MLRAVAAVLAAALSSGSLRADTVPELGPVPRLAEKGLTVEFVTGGYKMKLSRSAAEGLREALKRIDNEKEIGELLRDTAKDLTNEKVANELQVLALMISRETPKFKKSLDENMGENGVIISVYGLQRGKDRPLLRAFGRAVLPEEIKEQAKLLLAMAQTQGIFWKIEARQ